MADGGSKSNCDCHVDYALLPGGVCRCTLTLTSSHAHSSVVPSETCTNSNNTTSYKSPNARHCLVAQGRSALFDGPNANKSHRRRARRGAAVGTGLKSMNFGLDSMEFVLDSMKSVLH